MTMNGSDDQITIKKVIEKTDNSTIPLILGDIVKQLLGRPAIEKYVCDLMQSLSKDEADLIKYALETAKFIIHESFQFFERRKQEYDIALRWKRVFGFASPESLSSKASDLAFKDMTRVAEYFSGLQQRMIAGTIEMRRELTSSYGDKIRMMIAHGNGKLLDMPKEDLARIEKGAKILLDRLMEYEGGDGR